MCIRDRYFQILACCSLAFCSGNVIYYGHSCWCNHIVWLQMDFLIMEILLEKILTYSVVTILCVAVVWFYLLRKRRASGIVEAKIKKAQEEGLNEPFSLHPFLSLIHISEPTRLGMI